MIEITKGILLAFFIIMIVVAAGELIEVLIDKLFERLSGKPKLKTFLVYSAYNRDFTVMHASCVENILSIFVDILECSDDWIIYEVEDLNNVDTYRIAAARDNRHGVEVSDSERR